MSKFQFTIPSVLDWETGEEIVAKSFFSQPEATLFEVRRQLEDAIQARRPPKYTCYYCGQMIKMRGKAEGETKIKRMHFAHQRDSDDCPVKTSQTLTRLQIQAIKYNGEKESELHRLTKELVATSLEQNRLADKGVSSVEVEVIHRDKNGLLNWRKPDVSAQYNQYKVVFEIQLSTTFLSVIADREYFYRQNQTFIIWLFKRFSSDADKQRFTEKDVFYSNNRNAFIFDEEAIAESKQQQDLVLKCVYQEPYLEGQVVRYRWREQFVNLSVLTFDPETCQVYYYDVNGQAAALSGQVRQQELKRQLQEQQRRERARLDTEKTENDFLRAQLAISDRIEYQFPDYDTRSILLNEFANFSESTLDNLLHILYRYQPTAQERAFLFNEFRREKANRTMLERNDLLTCLSLSICLIKLEKPNRIYRAGKIVGVILQILSARLDCVVGQKYTQLIQVAHSVLPGRKEFAHLFLKAVSLYSANTIEQQDAKNNGKFAIKVATYYQTEVAENHQYDDIFRILFPDLFQAT